MRTIDWAGRVVGFLILAFLLFRYPRLFFFLLFALGGRGAGGMRAGGGFRGFGGGLSGGGGATVRW